jgi:hypothetical protein
MPLTTPPPPPTSPLPATVSLEGELLETVRVSAAAASVAAVFWLLHLLARSRHRPVACERCMLFRHRKIVTISPALVLSTISYSISWSVPVSNSDLSLLHNNILFHSPAPSQPLNPPPLPCQLPRLTFYNVSYHFHPLLLQVLHQCGAHGVSALLHLTPYFPQSRSSHTIT